MYHRLSKAGTEVDDSLSEKEMTRSKSTFTTVPGSKKVNWVRGPETIETKEGDREVEVPTITEGRQDTGDLRGW